MCFISCPRNYENERKINENKPIFVIFEPFSYGYFLNENLVYFLLTTFIC